VAEAVALGEAAQPRNEVGTRPSAVGAQPPSEVAQLVDVQRVRRAAAVGAQAVPALAQMPRL
jgi:hypothetical protein